MAWIVPVSALLIAQCTGPYCGPDADFERPNFGVGQAGAPAVALAPEGTFLVAWESVSGGERDILFNLREPGADGKWLEIPRRLDTDEPGASRSLEVRLAAGFGGRVYAAWQDARHGKDDIRFNRSDDGGRTWFAQDIRVGSSTPGTSSSSMASLAAAGPGPVYLVWEDLRGGDRDIYFSRSTDHGSTWELDRRVDSDRAGAGVSYHPQLVAWEDGTLLVCWWDEREGLADLYVRRSTDGGVSWEGPEVRLDSGAPGAVASRDARLAVAGDRIVVAWEEHTGGRIPQVLASVSEDRGHSWTEPQLHGNGEDPVPLASGRAAACLGWISRPRAWNGGKTSIGGRILEIRPPLTFHASSPSNRAAQRLSDLEGPSSIWFGASEAGAWAARTGGNGGRGIVEIFSEEEDGRWRRRKILPFGGHLLATDAEIQAHSVRGAVEKIGTVHLVWVAEIGGMQELGYYQLPRETARRGTR